MFHACILHILSYPCSSSIAVFTEISAVFLRVFKHAFHIPPGYQICISLFLQCIIKWEKKVPILTYIRLLEILFLVVCFGNSVFHIHSRSSLAPPTPPPPRAAVRLPPPPSPPSPPPSGLLCYFYLICSSTT